MVVELHAAVRFAWLWKNSTGNVSFKQSLINRLIFIAYDVVWWIPIVLPFTKTINYIAGFMTFTIITVARLSANLYRNNVLTLEQAVSFPFRTGSACFESVNSNVRKFCGQDYRIVRQKPLQN